MKDKIIKLHAQVKDADLFAWGTLGKMSVGNIMSLSVYLKAISYVEGKEYYFRKDLMRTAFVKKMKADDLRIQEMKISRHTLHKFLYTDREIGMKTATQICDYLGLEIDDFIYIKK